MLRELLEGELIKDGIQRAFRIVGKDALAVGGAVEGEAVTDLRAGPHGVGAVDLIQINDVAAVGGRQIHGLVETAAQRLQEGLGDGAEVNAGIGAQQEGCHTQAILAGLRVLLQKAFVFQGGHQGGGGGFMEAHLLTDLLQAQFADAEKAAQDRRCPGNGLDGTFHVDFIAWHLNAPFLGAHAPSAPPLSGGLTDHN